MLKELAAYLRAEKLLRLLSDALDTAKPRSLDTPRLRSMIWKQWKRGAVRFWELRRRDVSVVWRPRPRQRSRLGVWLQSALAVALPNAYFESLGLPSCSTVQRNPLNRPMRTRMSGGVAGRAGDRSPYADSTRTRTGYLEARCTQLSVRCTSAGLCPAFQ